MRTAAKVKCKKVCARSSVVLEEGAEHWQMLNADGGQRAVGFGFCICSGFCLCLCICIWFDLNVNLAIAIVGLRWMTRTVGCTHFQCGWVNCSHIETNTPLFWRPKVSAQCQHAAVRGHTSSAWGCLDKVKSKFGWSEQITKKTKPLWVPMSRKLAQTLEQVRSQ